MAPLTVSLDDELNDGAREAKVCTQSNIEIFRFIFN